MYKENAWKKYTEEEVKAVMDFNEGYKAFLSEGKTERACTAMTLRMAREKGFRDLEEVIEKGEKLKAGDKAYALNMNKNIALFVIGEKPLEEGMRILKDAGFSGIWLCEYKSRSFLPFNREVQQRVRRIAEQ